jgi:hypothetical protein
VVKNSLEPDWAPEQNTFEFDLSKGELTDLKITVKDWNRLMSAKLLGTACITVDKLKGLMAGEPVPKLGDEFYISSPDGASLIGKSKLQTFVVLKLKAKEGPPMAVPDSDSQKVGDAAAQVGATNLFNAPAKEAKTPAPLEETPSEKPHPPGVEKKGPSQDPILPQREPASAAGIPEFTTMCDIDNDLTTARPALKRVTLTDRGYEPVKLSPKTGPSQPPNSHSVQAPRSLYATDSSSSGSRSVQAPISLYATDSSKSGMDTLRGYCGSPPEAPRTLKRITLQDRGIDTRNRNLYVREPEHIGLYTSALSGPSAPLEIGQDASSLVPASDSPYRYDMEKASPQHWVTEGPLSSTSRMARSPEKSHMQRIQHYRYPNGDGLAKAHPEQATYGQYGPVDTGKQNAFSEQSQSRVIPAQWFSEPDAEDLAPGWEKKIDPKSQTEFYVNHDLKAMSWVRPRIPSTVSQVPSTVSQVPSTVSRMPNKLSSGPSSARRTGWKPYEPYEGSSYYQGSSYSQSPDSMGSLYSSAPGGRGRYTDFVPGSQYSDV